MIYGRFRAGETSAELAWIGGASGSAATGTGDRHGPSDRRRHGTVTSACERRPRSRRAGHQEPERPWASRSLAVSQHFPPSRHPGSASVIPPATAADLPNRQGLCLRNSSAGAPLRRHKCLFGDGENKTFGAIAAVTTQKIKSRQANSPLGLYHPVRHRHHPSPTAVRDGKRSNSPRLSRSPRVVFD